MSDSALLEMTLPAPSSPKDATPPLSFANNRPAQLVLIPNAKPDSALHLPLEPTAKSAPLPLNARPPELEVKLPDTATSLQVDASPKHAQVPFQLPLLSTHALTTL